VEPDRGARRVTAVPAVPDDVAEFYRTAYPRLLRVVGSVAGGVEDAESCVQDAFVQLLPRWDRVRRYDDPEAWVRQVAVRRVLSRHRRRQVAARLLPRLAQPDVVPGPHGDRLDVAGALRRLSPEARAVLVLHHGLGMPLPEVAAALGVPVGTVKSRLHRARAAFAAQYPTDVEMSRA
jgi:RNA polymerase sigma-70 factor (sigma-E family)